MAKKKLDHDISRKIDLLISSVERVYPTGWRLFFRSFLAGLYGALGATVGLSIAIVLLTLILTQLKIIPGVGELVKGANVEQILPKK